MSKPALGRGLGSLMGSSEDMDLRGAPLGDTGVQLLLRGSDGEVLVPPVEEQDRGTGSSRGLPDWAFAVLIGMDLLMIVLGVFVVLGLSHLGRLLVGGLLVLLGGGFLTLAVLIRGELANPVKGLFSGLRTLSRMLQDRLSQRRGATRRANPGAKLSSSPFSADSFHSIPQSSPFSSPPPSEATQPSTPIVNLNTYPPQPSSHPSFEASPDASHCSSEGTPEVAPSARATPDSTADSVTPSAPVKSGNTTPDAAPVAASSSERTHARGPVVPGPVPLAEILREPTPPKPREITNPFTDPKSPLRVQFLDEKSRVRR